VVVNGEGCYCIWPTDVAVPAGWTAIGFSGLGEIALNQVAELWRVARQSQRPATGD
jgi:MbtH protein